MDDLISRQEAIDKLSRTGDEILPGGILRGTVYRILENLPSAQPKRKKRKKGKWMKAYADIDVMGIRPFMRYCSECKEVTLQAYNYCPNCGAMMER